MYSFCSVFFFVALLYTFHNIHADDQSKAKIKKDPLTYTDKDVDALFEQWEKNDEDGLSEDEEHDFYLRHPDGKHQPSRLKQEDLVGRDPDKLFQTMKKGQTTMIFAIVSGNPTKLQTQEIAEIWWIALRNALVDVHKYVIDTNRILFLVQDGALAYEVKNFLVKQDRCEEVSIDNQAYPGKGARKVPKFKLVEL